MPESPQAAEPPQQEPPLQQLHAQSLQEQEPVSQQPQQPHPQPFAAVGIAGNPAKAIGIKAKTARERSLDMETLQ